MNAPNYVIRKLLLIYLYFFYLQFFDFMWYLCWVLFKWKNGSIDYSKYEYLPDKEKYSNSNENMLFLRKTDQTIWKPPLQLTPLFLSNIFMTPLFVQISKTRNRPLILGGGGETMQLYLIWAIIEKVSELKSCHCMCCFV